MLAVLGGAAAVGLATSALAAVLGITDLGQRQPSRLLRSGPRHELLHRPGLNRREAQRHSLNSECGAPGRTRTSDTRFRKSDWVVRQRSLMPALSSDCRCFGPRRPRPSVADRPNWGQNWGHLRGAPHAGSPAIVLEPSAVQGRDRWRLTVMPGRGSQSG